MNILIELSDASKIAVVIENGDIKDNPILKDYLQSKYAKGEYTVIADSVPQPIAVVADWEALCKQILGGALNGVYNRLTEACFLNPATATLQQLANANNIAVAAGKLDQAVAVTRVEGAVAASFQLVVNTSDYRFTQAEKNLWNAEVIKLNFTSLMQIA